MTDNTMRAAALKATLRNLIDTQSEGEWGAALIEKDVEVFAAALLPLFDIALAAARAEGYKAGMERAVEICWEHANKGGTLGRIAALQNCGAAIRAEIGKEET